MTEPGFTQWIEKMTLSQSADSEECAQVAYELKLNRQDHQEDLLSTAVKKLDEQGDYSEGIFERDTQGVVTFSYQDTPLLQFREPLLTSEEEGESTIVSLEYYYKILG